MFLLLARPKNGLQVASSPARIGGQMEVGPTKLAELAKKDFDRHFGI